MPDPTSETLDRIHDRIASAAPAGVWSPADFLDIGTPNAVEKALQRLVNRGDIRRPHRGLYDTPTTSQLTGKMVFPPRASFIDAIARRDKLRVLVDGMTAANDLGLTTAVPAHSTTYADTYPRTIEIEANAGDPNATKPVIYTLDFKRISAKTAFWAGAARQYIVGTLRDLLTKEIAAVEGEVGQSWHFTLDFGYDAYGKKKARDILVLRYAFPRAKAGCRENQVFSKAGLPPPPIGSFMGLTVCTTLLGYGHGEHAISNAPVRIVVLVHENENVFGRYRSVRLQVPGNGGIERTLHCIASSSSHGDLDDDQIVRAGDAVETPVEEELAIPIFGHEVEQFILWHPDAFDQGIVNALHYTLLASRFGTVG